MLKTEILYSILLISILILIMVYYKTSVNNLFKKALKFLNILIFDNNQKVEKVESIDNFFDTEYEVTEDAGDAISDALKDI